MPTAGEPRFPRPGGHGTAPWAYLSSLGRLTPKEVDRLARRLGQVAIGAELNWLRSPQATQIAVQPPAVLRAELGATITVEAAELPAALLATLRHAASMPYPVFDERQRRRACTWDTPRLRRNYDETEGGLTALVGRQPPGARR